MSVYTITDLEESLKNMYMATSQVLIVTQEVRQYPRDMDKVEMSKRLQEVLADIESMIDSTRGPIPL